MCNNTGNFRQLDLALLHTALQPRKELDLNYLCLELLKPLQTFAMSYDSKYTDVELTQEKYEMKRSRNPDTWQRVIAKKKRNKGEMYVSSTTKRIVGARVVGQPCRDGCFDRVTRDGVESIFRAFWDLGDHDAQTHYLQKMMNVIPVKRKRTCADVSRRSNTIEYTVLMNHQPIKVCKKGFVAMHGISNSRTLYALRKMTNTGLLIPDQRGRREPANKIADSDLERVKEHIRLLLSSQCSQTKSLHHFYIESGLNVPKMHNNYISWMKNNHPSEKKVTQHYYRDILNKYFDIISKHLRTDTSIKCDSLSIAQQNAMDVLEKVAKHQQDLEEHKSVERKVQHFMEGLATIDDPDLMAICLDVQHNKVM